MPCKLEKLRLQKEGMFNHVSYCWKSLRFLEETPRNRWYSLLHFGKQNIGDERRGGEGETLNKVEHIETCHRSLPLFLIHHSIIQCLGLCKVGCWMGTEWLVGNHMEVLNVVRFQKFRMNGDTRMCSHYQRRKKETLQVNMRNLTLSSKLKMLGVYYIICDVIITESRGQMGVWLKKILKICSEVSFFFFNKT